MLRPILLHMVAGLQILEGPLPAKAPLLKKGPEEYTAYRSVLAVVDTSDLLLNFRWIPLHQVAQGSSYVFLLLTQTMGVWSGPMNGSFGSFGRGHCQCGIL